MGLYTLNGEVPPHWWGCHTGKGGNCITDGISSCSALTFFKQYTPKNKYLNFDTALVGRLYKNDKFPHRSFYQCITLLLRVQNDQRHFSFYGSVTSTTTPSIIKCIIFKRKE